MCRGPKESDACPSGVAKNLFAGQCSEQLTLKERWRNPFGCIPLMWTDSLGFLNAMRFVVLRSKHTIETRSVTLTICVSIFA